MDTLKVEVSQTLKSISMKKEDIIKIFTEQEGLIISPEMKDILADKIIGQVDNCDTLAEAKQYLKDNWTEGCKCPACTQNVKLYKHKINGLTAKSLIDLYNLTFKYPNKFYFHVHDDIDVPLKVGGGFAKLRWWKLIEEMPNEEGSSSRTSGYWKITETGKSFVKNEFSIPVYSKLYNMKHYGFTGDKVTIIDSLTSKFNYKDLMND
jgi:hypothetical protein